MIFVNIIFAASIIIIIIIPFRYSFITNVMMMILIYYSLLVIINAVINITAVIVDITFIKISIFIRSLVRNKFSLSLLTNLIILCIRFLVEVKKKI